MGVSRFLRRAPRMLAGSFLRDRTLCIAFFVPGMRPVIPKPSRHRRTTRCRLGLLLSEAKNKTAFAISSAVPRRPLGRACRFALSLLSLWLIDHDSRHLIEEFP